VVDFDLSFTGRDFTIEYDKPFDQAYMRPLSGTDIGVSWRRSQSRISVRMTTSQRRIGCTVGTVLMICIMWGFVGMRDALLRRRAAGSRPPICRA